MDLSSAVPFEVESQHDLARIIVSSTSNQHGTLYLMTYKEKIVLCTLTNFSGYYNLAGLPVVLFTYVDKEPSGPFLRFDVRSDAKDSIRYVNGFDEGEANLGYIQYIPIIKLKNVPVVFTGCFD